MTAGIDAARGDAVVCMDGDLQDPPELIPELLARWREGFDVVFAVRRSRPGETRYKIWTARAFYRLIGRMSPVEIPEDAGDFRLLSRRAADALRAMPERARFLRGMTSWIGFGQIGVSYEREPRTSGETKYPTRKMVRFAMDAITSFSTAPLRVVGTVGFALVAFCAVYLAYTLYKRLLTDDTVEGWTTVIVLMLLIGGVQLVSLGVIGEYVGRVFEEVKHRPLYVVSEERGDFSRLDPDTSTVPTRSSSSATR
jgi:dolichol-phosphate mannosyltransferase